MGSSPTRLTFVTAKPAKGAKKPEPHKIMLGLSNDREVEIAKGLKAGDKVVIKPASAADNSMKF